MKETTEYPKNNPDMKYCRKGNHMVIISNFTTNGNRVYSICYDCQKVKNKLYYERKLQQKELNKSQAEENLQK